MAAIQLSLFGDEFFSPIPECDPILTAKYGKEERVAQLMVSTARRWRDKNPGRDIMEVIPTEWREYVRENI